MNKTYRIFIPQARKNGRLQKAGFARQRPARNGEIADPIERATPVTPEAAERSSGRTTAMVYDCRVGTSICEILKRTKRTRMASDSDGISGTRRRRMFDGKC